MGVGLWVRLEAAPTEGCHGRFPCMADEPGTRLMTEATKA